MPELTTAEPVSTSQNAMDMLIMQNEMDKISQEDSRIALEDMLHGSIRNPVPRIEGPGGLGMLDWAGGPLKGMGMLASRKTVSKMLKDLIFETKGAESKWGAAKKLLQEAAAPRNIGREHGIDEFKVADEMFRQKDIYNTNASLIQTLRNWQKLTKKAVKK